MTQLDHIVPLYTRVSVGDQFDSDILFDILGVDQVIKVMVEVKVKINRRSKSCLSGIECQNGFQGSINKLAVKHKYR